jgi:hypothetical protein
MAVDQSALLEVLEVLKAGDLVKALGADSRISKSEVSRICTWWCVLLSSDGRAGRPGSSGRRRRRRPYG